jgi:hypothetical protein
VYIAPVGTHRVLCTALTSTVEEILVRSADWGMKLKVDGMLTLGRNSLQTEMNVKQKWRNKNKIHREKIQKYTKSSL